MPENIAGFDASFQSATNTPIDAASFTIYDRGFIGVPDHAEGTFYNVAGAPVTSLVDRVVYESSVPHSGGISTNDVCNIVTNEARIVSAWTIEGLQPGDTYQFWDDGPGWQGWSWGLIVTDKDGNVYYGGTGWTTEGPDDATKVVFGNGWFIATRTVEIKNALGLAREKDLPQVAPVDEIRFNGADGKVYRLRIGAGGSIDIYTEVTP